jgi:hypothetical protein
MPPDPIREAIEALKQRLEHGAAFPAETPSRQCFAPRAATPQ